MPKETKIIGVWGTLRRGSGNNVFLSKSKYLGDDFIPKTLKVGLSISPHKSEEVPIELYEVSNDVYDVIDRFENNFSYYAKPTKLRSGKEVMVWWNNF